jgi:hypothetical protein
MSTRDPKSGDESEESMPESGHEKIGARAGDLLKKAITVGLGAAFLTEESIRSIVGELRVYRQVFPGTSRAIPVEDQSGRTRERGFAAE